MGPTVTQSAEEGNPRRKDRRRMARKKHRGGIIGLGFGRAHIPAFQANGCEVVAVCQRNQETARAVAERYGVPGVFERWERMLEETKPDIAVIASPPNLH